MPDLDLDPHEWRLKGAKPVQRKPEDPLGPNTYRIIARDQIPAEHIAFPFQAGVPGAGVYIAGIVLVCYVARAPVTEFFAHLFGLIGH